MHATFIRTGLLLLGCLGCAVLAAERSNPLPGGPPTIDPDPAQELEDGSTFLPSSTARYDLRGLDEAMAREQKRRSETLFTWNLPSNMQLDVVGKPDFEEVNLPWAPAASSLAIPADSKVEMRVPVLSLDW